MVFLLRTKEGMLSCTCQILGAALDVKMLGQAGLVCWFQFWDWCEILGGPHPGSKLCLLHRDVWGQGRAGWAGQSQTAEPGRQSRTRLKAPGLYKWILLKWKFPPIPEMSLAVRPGLVGAAAAGDMDKDKSQACVKAPPTYPPLPMVHTPLPNSSRALGSAGFSFITWSPLTLFPSNTLPSCCLFSPHGPPHLPFT